MRLLLPSLGAQGHGGHEVEGEPDAQFPVRALPLGWRPGDHHAMHPRNFTQKSQSDGIGELPGIVRDRKYRRETAGEMS